MSPSAKVLLTALAVGAVFVVVARRWRRPHQARARVYGPRSRKADDSYQAAHAAAGLLSDVLDLRGRKARWPAILQTLNPDESPSLRTVLLELRWLHVDEPSRALWWMEEACIQAKGRALSRLELLERAKVLSEGAEGRP